MKYNLHNRLFIVLYLISCAFPGKEIKAQAFDFNTFFTAPAIGFFTPDSNNMIYDELKNPAAMVAQLDSIFPYSAEEYYGSYSKIQVQNSISFLPGLHNQLPLFDNQAAEVKGQFTLNEKIDYWYAYYKKSIQDTTTAIIIFPGSGLHESFLISNNEPNDYHNQDCFIKEKCLEYGDVYVIVKPNEDFRSIWKTVSPGLYKKLDYDVMGPYTDFMGKNWAANLYIELLAQLKYLQSKYKRVLVIGLSNGGFPALVCGLEAEVDGINCASGISTTSYTGFPVPNNQNPLFSNLFNYYALDSIKNRINHSQTSILFSYGAGDCCTNAYEYNYHSLQNYLNTPGETCNGEFFYNFTGHTFPCDALGPFFTKVVQSPRAEAEIVPGTCIFDSLQLLIKLQGSAPFDFDLYKNELFYNHYHTNEQYLRLSFTVAGDYHIKNLNDAGGYPLCNSVRFTYVKPAVPGTTQGYPVLTLDNNSYLVATETSYWYQWYKDGIFLDSTNENRLITYGGGEYYVLLKDSSGCTFISNILTVSYPSLVNVYPNPAYNSVNILVNGQFKGSWQYNIYDNAGRKTVHGNSVLPHALVNIERFSTGIYNFVVEYNNQNGEKIRKTVRILKK